MVVETAGELAACRRVTPHAVSWHVGHVGVQQPEGSYMVHLQSAVWPALPAAPATPTWVSCSLEYSSEPTAGAPAAASCCTSSPSARDDVRRASVLCRSSPPGSDLRRASGAGLGQHPLGL